MQQDSGAGNATAVPVASSGERREGSNKRAKDTPLVSVMANVMFYDDDFDFGGDDGDDNAKSVGKRTSGELEDDDDDVDLYPSKKMYGSTAVGNDHATTTILNLRASLEERDSTIAELQNNLNTANGDLKRWRATFQIESFLPLIANPEPDVVLEAFQKLQASEAQLKEQLLSAKWRCSTMLVKLSGKEHDIVELKSLVHDLRLMLKPTMLQARHLLLDPAIHTEFTRMKKELENAEKKVKELQDDIAAVQFTPQSKNGKMLMAKCRTLQEENEEIGREASEGKMQELGSKLSMQKSLTLELIRGYQELFEYLEDLNYEAERAQQAIYLMERQVQQKEREIHQKDFQLAEYRKKNELQDANIKSMEEERGQKNEGMRNGYGGEDDLRNKPAGESRRR